jgi:hypothetical protein
MSDDVIVMAPPQADLRVMVAIPTAGRVPIAFASSLAGMVARMATARCPTVPDKSITMSLRVLESSNWITNREKLARQAVDEGYTHLMFLDDDMAFAPEVFEILLGRRHDIVVTNYLIKTEPAGDFVAVNEAGQRVPTKHESTGLQEIAYSGFGVSLIATEVFRKTPQPWFIPEFNSEKSEYTTEDNPFFARARKAGFRVYLDHDASKLVGHHGNKQWRWDEVKNA